MTSNIYFNERSPAKTYVLDETNHVILFHNKETFDFCYSSNVVFVPFFRRKFLPRLLHSDLFAFDLPLQFVPRINGVKLTQASKVHPESTNVKVL